MFRPNLALFAGGQTSPTVPSAFVDVFDAKTMTWSTTTLSLARSLLCATTVGTKAIFAGGGIQDSPLLLSDRVDKQLCRGQPGHTRLLRWRYHEPQHGGQELQG